ncbi:porin [Sphingobacterium paludis]|nr:porin [Sphingobacterium paludis]
MKRRLIVTIISIFNFGIVSAQSETDTLQTAQDSLLVNKPKLKQQPGLALAASKIFFSDKRWSVSGFGEYNYVPIQQHVDNTVGDLELYYSGLYRQAVFFGYKLSDKWIWNSELQVEFLHFKNQESHQELVFEAFVDYLFKDYLKARVGFYPLTIGYVNNNDEPVMFYSVNRSEVERLITPSTWIEFGTMLYGNLSKEWSYAIGVSQGLNAQNYLSGSWIRQGREIRFGVPQSVSINPQINYHGIENLTLFASGYYGNSGQGNRVQIDGRADEVKAKITLSTAYAKYDWRNFRFVTVGTYGSLGDTEKLYELTKDETGENGQVLGKQTYGYLFELGCDILPYIRKSSRMRPHKKTFLYDNHDMKFSLFSRYERLNTHQRVHQELVSLPRTEGNMKIFTMGANFNTKENIVIKANYQRRKNQSNLDPRPVKNIVETGLGFIF